MSITSFLEKMRNVQIFSHFSRAPTANPKQQPPALAAPHTAAVSMAGVTVLLPHQAPATGGLSTTISPSWTHFCRI